MFAHEKLNVYGKALAFAANASAFSSGWDRKHAVAEQMNRALDSIVLNLAESAQFCSTAIKINSLDCAIGSSLECAACLDIAWIKALLTESDTHREKRRLCEITSMLYGLRKAWSGWKLSEEPRAYGASHTEPSCPRLFHHEGLEVYVAALELVRWFVGLPEARALSSRPSRQLDDAVTSVVLNIAEGNGRYSSADHRRFLGIANRSAVKAAAYLDLAVHKVALDKAQCVAGKALLERIVAMLPRLRID